jgi:hypothetical protein
VTIDYSITDRAHRERMRRERNISTAHMEGSITRTWRTLYKNVYALKRDFGKFI